MKKKVDFKKIEVENIDGDKWFVDLSKELGNGIFNTTMDIGEYELAKGIYMSGEVEIDEAQAGFLSRFIKENFKAFVQVSVCPMLDNLFINDKN